MKKAVKKRVTEKHPIVAEKINKSLKSSVKEGSYAALSLICVIER